MTYSDKEVREDARKSVSTVITEESVWSVFPADRHYSNFPYLAIEQA
jgi:hypothetical protein